MIHTAKNNIETHPLHFNPPSTVKNTNLNLKDDKKVASYWNHVQGETWMDWESYIALHPDLQHFSTFSEAYHHYMKFGSHESRCYLLLQDYELVAQSCIDNQALVSSISSPSSLSSSSISSSSSTSSSSLSSLSSPLSSTTKRGKKQKKKSQKQPSTVVHQQPASHLKLTPHDHIIHAAKQRYHQLVAEQFMLKDNAVYTKPCILIILHGLYTRLGGVGTFIKSMMDLLSDTFDIVLLYPWINTNTFRITVNNRFAHQYDQLDDAFKDLEMMNMCGCFMVHFYGFDAEKLLTHVQGLKIPYIITLHDYYWLSSQIPVPDVLVDFKNMSQEVAERWFTHSVGVISPSHDLQAVHQIWFPDTTITVIPHQSITPISAIPDKFITNTSSTMTIGSITSPLSLLSQTPPSLPTTSCNVVPMTHDCDHTTYSSLPSSSSRPLTILVTGMMYIWYKGGQLVRQTAQAFPNIQFVVLGDMDAQDNHQTQPTNLHIRGRFKESDIQSLIKQEDPDYIWTPGQYRESYSYNLDHHLLSGYRLLLPDLDIYKERAACLIPHERVVFYDNVNVALNSLVATHHSTHDHVQSMMSTRCLALLQLDHCLSPRYKEMAQTLFDIDKPSHLCTLLNSSWFQLLK